jgi:toxin secretion/phage lysis holin
MKYNTFKSIIAVLMTGVSYVFGIWDINIIILLSSMALDYITGVFVGFSTATLNSTTSFKGLLKKMTILIILIVAVMLDRLISNGSWVFRTLVAYFYIANECISILENAGKLGLPLPPKLLNVLEQLKSKADLQEGDTK